MGVLTPRRAAVASMLLALAIGVVVALRPSPLGVEAVPASRGPLRVTVEGSGKTRVRDRCVVAAPICGHLERVSTAAGDAVRAGTWSSA